MAIQYTKTSASRTPRATAASGLTGAHPWPVILPVRQAVRTLMGLAALALGMAGALAPAGVAAQSPTPIQPPPGTVTLPLAEYNRLLDRGAAATTGREDPPVPAVISRAAIDLRVAAGAARAAITLQGEVFRSGPTDVPLLSGGTLIDAQLTSPGAAGAPATPPPPPAAGAAAPVVPLVHASGVYKAILPGRAPFTLALTWGTLTLSEPGRAVLLLPAVHAGSVQASIELPGDIGDVRVQPGAITARTVVAGRTRFDVTLDPGVPARVSWSSRDTTETTTRREVRLLSDAKTLVTIGEADMRMASLFDVTVVQGEPARVDVRVPAGFEVTSVSGASVEESSSSTRAGVVSLTIREPARRRHQFLIALERATPGVGSGQASPGGEASAPQPGAAPASAGDVPLPWIEGVQRETGEVAIEGVGTLDLAAAEKGALHRIDATELSTTLLSLTRAAVLAAFRYQRRTAEAVTLDLNVTRFPASSVLAAGADGATVTTLVTRQGRALTEVSLRVRNQGQPFMKVGLPQGATLLSAEVAGVSVKPVLGADGARIPLLRPGFRPTRESYAVSFVYLESGAEYGKKGEAQLTLARLDLPVTLLEWELFLPDGFQVKRFEGDVLPRELVAATLSPEPDVVLGGVVGGVVGAAPGGAIGGVIDGRPSAPPPPALAAPGLYETVTVEENKPKFQAQVDQTAQMPSVNVQNLQRRIAGVLPVRIDVPRAGHSYLFVRPVVIDEATTVRFSYRAKS